MADRDLCTTSQVKELLPLNKSVSVDDPFLQRLVMAASEATRKYIGDALNVASYTEIRNGTGTGRLILRHTPVIAVTSLSIGSPPATRSPLVYGTDYVWDELGISLLAGQNFPRGVATISAIYKAGFVAIPADVVNGVATWAALRYKESERLGQSSKTLGPETVNFDLKAMPASVKLVFDQYKRVAQVGAS
jgi:hypothetical protein